MAQVIKKLQSGGTTSSAKTFGWNGHQIEATEENLNKLASASSIAAQMVRDGYQINWDSNTQNLNHVTPEGKYNVKTLGKELRNMKNINFTPKQDPIYKLDLSDQINLKYIQSGDNIVLADTPETEAFLDRVKYFISGGEGAKKYNEYDLSSTSFDNIDSAFKYWADSERQKYFSDKTKDKNGNTFVDRIKKGIATPQDVEYLKSMGIKYSDADANSSSSKQESDIKNTFKQYGLDPTKHGQYFTIDQDGDLVATSTLTDVVGMNAAFNDDFFSKYTNNNDLNFLKNKILFGGQLYNSDVMDDPNSYVRTQLDNQGYRKYLAAGQYDAANQIFRTNWDENGPTNPWTYNTSENYHDFFSNPENSKLLFEELTGEYVNGDKQLLRVINPDDAAYDNWGMPTKFKYAEFGADGSFLGWVDNLENSQWKYDPIGSRKNFNDVSSWAINQENGDNGLKGTYQVGGTENTDIKIFRTPDQKKMYIQADFNDRKLDNTQYGVEVPKELISYLTNDKLGEIISEEKQKDLYKVLKNPKQYNVLIRLFGRNVADEIYKNNNWSRPGQNVDQSPSLGIARKKEGGIIKANKGIELSKPYVHQSKAAGFGSKDSKTMDTADWADLTALVADIGSIGLTLAPGVGNVAAAGVGAAGSLATFGADLSRDGFQGRDLGNLLLNLGLDTGTLIPGIGTGAKVTKAGKAIKKIAPVLIKAASAWGLGDAFVNTVNKISNGESFTINDVRRIVNGIQGGITLNKVGIKNPGKQVTEAGIPETTKLSGGKGKTKLDVELSKAEIEKIQNLPAGEQRKKYEELLFKKALAAKKAKGLKKTDGDMLEQDKILDYFGIDTKTVKTGEFWKPKTWGNKSDVPDFKQEKTVEFNYDRRPNTKRKYWTGRVFHADDPARLAYNRYLFGDGKAMEWDPNYIIRGDKGRFAGKGKYKQKRGEKGKFISREKAFGNLYLPNLTSHDEKVYSSYQEQVPLIYKPSYKKGGVLKANLGVTLPSKLDVEDFVWNQIWEKYPGNGELVKTNPIIPETKNYFHFPTPTKTVDGEYRRLSYEPELIGKNFEPTPVTINDGIIQVWNPTGLDNRSVEEAFLKSEREKFNRDEFLKNFVNSLNDETKNELFGQNTPVKPESKFFDTLSQIVSPDALLKAGSFIGSIAGADKIRQHQYETAENVAKSKLKTHVDLGTPRYDQSVLDRSLNDQLKTIQSVPVISTDQNAINAANLQKAEMENAARTQYNQELGKYRSDYLTQKQAIDDQNRITRQATEDYNRGVGFEEAASKSQADAAFDAQKTQSALNLMYEERAKLAKLQDLQQKYQQLVDRQNMQIEAEGEAQEYLKGTLGDEWGEGSDNYKKYNGNALNYLKSNQDVYWKYEELMKKFSQKTLEDQYNLQLKNFGLYSKLPQFQFPERKEPVTSSGGSPTISHTNPQFDKKGGKIRSTGDQMLIDQNKAAHRLISKLNDNVIELFYKTK